MIVTILDTKSNKPLANAQVKLHIQGDNNPLAMKTDQSGHVELNDNLKGKQIASSLGNGQSPWTTAVDGATIKVAEKNAQTSSNSGGQSGNQAGNKSGTQQGSNKNKETWK